MDASSMMYVEKPVSCRPPDLLYVKFSLSQFRCGSARNEWIVVARFPVASRMRSAAFPVGASNWNEAPPPWAFSTAWMIALMTVVLPVPASTPR